MKGGLGPHQPMPEGLRLYIFCKNLKFSHLPAPGSIYSQHPKLIDDWSIIMGIESEIEKKKSEEQAREARQKGKRGRR